jgi:hypothetical protein
MPLERGSVLKLTIVEDFGTRLTMDHEFRFAKVRLASGDVTTVSFDQREFAKLKNDRGEITAAAVASLFRHAPTTFDTSQALAARAQARLRENVATLEAYSAEMNLYMTGRVATKPSFPASFSEMLPKPPEALQDGGVWHLRIDPRDLDLSKIIDHPVATRSEYDTAMLYYRLIANAPDAERSEAA